MDFGVVSKSSDDELQAYLSDKREHSNGSDDEGSRFEISYSGGRVSPLNPPRVGFGQVLLGSLAVAGIAIGIFGILAFYNRQPFAQWSSRVTQILNDKVGVGQIVNLGSTVVPISSMVIGGVGSLTLGGLFVRHVVKTRQHEKDCKKENIDLPQKEGLSARRVMWASAALAASLIAGLLIASYVLGVKEKTSFGQWMQKGLTRYSWLPLVILPSAAVASLTTIFATFKALANHPSPTAPSEGGTPSRWEDLGYETPTEYVVDDEE